MGVDVIRRKDIAADVVECDLHIADFSSDHLSGINFAKRRNHATFRASFFIGPHRFVLMRGYRRLA